jgi:hypothetical protein
VPVVSLQVEARIPMAGCARKPANGLRTLTLMGGLRAKARGRAPPPNPQRWLLMLARVVVQAASSSGLCRRIA